MHTLKQQLRILILGGRGFVGRAICNRLKKYSVFTFDTHTGLKNHFQGNINSASDLKKAMNGMDVIINLVGLTPIKKPLQTSYYEIHVQGAKNVVSACKELKIKRLIHMSALGADKNSPIAFLRTKGLGEELVLKLGLNVTVFCPSLIFDKENELVQQLSRTAFTRMFPKIPAQLQPIYRKDIAQLFALAVQGKIKEKKVEVGGPDVMTIFEMAQKIYHKNGYYCLPIPLFFLKFGMKIAAWLHLFGITNDQIRNLYVDNITQSNMAEKYIQLTQFNKWLRKISL